MYYVLVIFIVNQKAFDSVIRSELWCILNYLESYQI